MYRGEPAMEIPAEEGLGRLNKAKLIICWHSANLVVFLPPTLIDPHSLLRSQGAKDGYITPKACLSPSPGRGFFLPQEYFFRI
jgi:hypothetical protein